MALTASARAFQPSVRSGAGKAISDVAQKLSAPGDFGSRSGKGPEGQCFLVLGSLTGAASCCRGGSKVNFFHLDLVERGASG